MVEFYYLDNHVAVCEKPSGLLSEGEGKDCFPALIKEALAQRGEDASLFTVHRLDRETEGIMVYARTKKAAATLSEAIADNRLEKEYIALVHGRPEASEGQMEDLLFYDRQKNRSYPVKRERKGVKHALLEYKVLNTDAESNITRVRIRLHTGRTHQIRVQFASRKMPLVGDRRYGAPDSGQPLSLRACMLAFDHPVSGERMSFEKI